MVLRAEILQAVAVAVWAATEETVATAAVTPEAAGAVVTEAMVVMASKAQEEAEELPEMAEMAAVRVRVAAVAERSPGQMLTMRPVDWEAAAVAMAATKVKTVNPVASTVGAVVRVADCKPMAVIVPMAELVELMAAVVAVQFCNTPHRISDMVPAEVAISVAVAGLAASMVPIHLPARAASVAAVAVAVLLIPARCTSRGEPGALAPAAVALAPSPFRPAPLADKVDTFYTVAVAVAAVPHWVAQYLCAQPTELH